MIRKALLAPLTVLALVIGINVATQAPAHAAQSDCGVGYVVCLWAGAEPFTGSIYKIPPQPLGYCYNLPDWYNDEANHFYNRYQTRHVQFYQDRDCTGHQLHKNVPGCPTGPFPGQTSGEFWWDRSYTGNCHSANYDTNRLTSVFFNTG